jgi:hypothetical protein
VPPPAPPAPPRRPGWLAPALAIFLVVVVVLGGVGGYLAFSSSSSETTSKTTAPTITLPPLPTTTTPAAPTTSAASGGSALEAFIPTAEAFVEQHRGLKFENPVKVTLLDDTAFKQKLLSDEQTDQAQVEKATKVLRALGLIQGNVDVAKAMQALLGGAVAGFYDPKTKELFVRGAQPTPYVRQVLVHELTHALQDQHFSIDRPDLDKADDERGDAFSALVEGDAVRIETEYKNSLSLDEQQQATNEENSQASGISPDIPPVLIEQLVFPYQAGPPFTEALVRAGGQATLDAAFSKPPTTSEQVMHPDKYLRGEGAANVAEPATDGGAKVIDRGVIGEFGLLVLLNPAVTNGTLSQTAMRQAAAGWGGDKYVAWDAGGRTCVRDSFVMDTSADNSELLSALRRWASARSGVTISGTGPILLTSCG